LITATFSTKQNVHALNATTVFTVNNANIATTKDVLYIKHTPATAAHVITAIDYSPLSHVKNAIIPTTTAYHSTPIYAHVINVTKEVFYLPTGTVIPATKALFA